MPKKYETDLDELNVIMLESYYAAGKNRSKDVADDLFEILVDAYIAGVDQASEEMDQIITVDADRMDEVIHQKFDRKDFADRVADHVREEDVRGLEMLAVSEYHRVYNTAMNDAIQTYVRDTGAKVMKTWHTMRDDRVRDTHIPLEGQTIGVNDLFFADDGDQAPYPGGFANPENNVNCRCYLVYRRVNS